MIAASLDALSPDQLRDAVHVLLADVASKRVEIAFKQATIDKLAHEMAVSKRLKFAVQSESFKLNGLEPYAYLKDVLIRLPTQPAGRIEQLLPHRWRSAVTI